MMENHTDLPCVDYAVCKKSIRNTYIHSYKIFNTFHCKCIFYVFLCERHVL